jgi:acyl carrier protein
MSRAEARLLLRDLVRREVARVLGHAGPDGIEWGASFKDAGFDSLAAVRLRNRLVEETALSLPTTLVFEYPSPDVLLDHLLDRLAEGGRLKEDAEATPAAQGPPATEGSVLADLVRLDEALTALAGPAGDVPSTITARVTALLSRWHRAVGPSAGAATDLVDRIGEATEEEVLRLIDQEFGRSAN